jgi:hypothetical protein
VGAGHDRGYLSKTNNIFYPIFAKGATCLTRVRLFRFLQVTHLLKVHPLVDADDADELCHAHTSTFPSVSPPFPFPNPPAPLASQNDKAVSRHLDTALSFAFCFKSTRPATGGSDLVGRGRRGPGCAKKAMLSGLTADWFD